MSDYQPKLRPDGSLIYTEEEFETWKKANPVDPRERVWCCCGHSLLVHANGNCTGIHTTGMNDDTPCRCPMFFAQKPGGRQPMNTFMFIIGYAAIVSGIVGIVVALVLARRLADRRSASPQEDR